MGASALQIKSPGTSAPSSGLVGEWTMDSVSGANLYDSSGLGNTGFIDGATQVAGKQGQALSFVAANSQNVGVNNHASLQLSSWTVSGWVNLASLPSGYPSIIVKGNGTNYGLGYDNNYINADGHSGSGWWVWMNPSYSGAVNFNAKYNTIPSIGVWYHLVGTWDDANHLMTLYLNGQLVAMRDPGSGVHPFIDDAVLTIGQDSCCSDGYLDGKIDDVRVYNRALSANEIKQLYNSYAPKTDSLTNGLVGWWTFDGADISGTKAYDKSGLGNTGTISGTTVAEGKLGQALSFNRSTSYVDLGTAAILTGREPAWGICAWVKPSSTSGANNEYEVYLRSADGTGNFQLTVGNYTTDDLVWRITTNDGSWHDYTSFVPLQVKKWGHICATSQDGSNISFYTNGKYSNTRAFTKPSDVADLRQSVGADMKTGSPTFVMDGSIDDIRVYNRGLSANEIQRIYNLGR